MPIYPVYALLFVDSGMSDGQISALLAIWSAVGIAAEVPMGAVADRWSHRNALVAGALLQALGYVAWILAPGFTGFAIGFVVWALGGALVSGSSEALLYEGLTAAGAADHYARVQGWATAAEFLAFIPAVLVATALLPIGGYAAIGWVSVATCLAAAVLARRLPSAPATADLDDDDGSGTLRAGLREAMRPTVAGAVIALAVIGGFDAIEEYFPLLAQDWGVPTAWVPIAVLVVTMAGALGAALGGRCATFSGTRDRVCSPARRRLHWRWRGSPRRLADSSPSPPSTCCTTWCSSSSTPACRRGSKDAPGRRRRRSPASGRRSSGSACSGSGRVGHLALVTVLWFAVAAALPVMLRRSRRSAMIGTERRSDERSDEAGLVRGR